MRYAHKIIFLLIVLVLLGCASYAVYTALSGQFSAQTLKTTLENHGVVAPLIYTVITAIAVIISPIPAMPLYMSASLLWHPLFATALTVAGNLAGAIVSFLIARYLGREGVSRIFKRDISICSTCSQRSLFFILVIARFFPLFHFDIISYAAGLTPMSLRSFSVATILGMLPKITLIMYMGNSFIMGDYVITALSIVAIAALFCIPIILNHYNILGWSQVHQTLKAQKERVNK